MIFYDDGDEQNYAMEVSVYINARSEEIKWQRFQYKESIIWEQHFINHPVKKQRMFGFLTYIFGTYLKNKWVLHNISGPASVNYNPKAEDPARYLLYGIEYDKEDWFNQLSTEEKREAIWRMSNEGTADY